MTRFRPALLERSTSDQADPAKDGHASLFRSVSRLFSGGMGYVGSTDNNFGTGHKNEEYGTAFPQEPES